MGGMMRMMICSTCKRRILRKRQREGDSRHDAGVWNLLKDDNTMVNHNDKKLVLGRENIYFYACRISSQTRRISYNPN